MFLKTDMALDETGIQKGQCPGSGQCPLPLGKIEALRDFFDAADGREIERSFSRLSRCFNQGLCKETQYPDISWVEIEYQFNRLFVGPGQITAPPYASVYLEKQPVLMGPTTLDIRGIYASLELEVPDKGRIPDDFIAYELEALHVILTTHPLDALVLEQFLVGHMIRWIPKFCDRCRQHPNLIYPVEQTIEWLEWTINSLHLGMCSKTNEKRPIDGNQTQNQ